MCSFTLLRYSYWTRMTCVFTKGTNKYGMFRVCVQFSSSLDAKFWKRVLTHNKWNDWRGFLMTWSLNEFNYSHLGFVWTNFYINYLATTITTKLDLLKFTKSDTKTWTCKNSIMRFTWTIILGLYKYQYSNIVSKFLAWQKSIGRILTIEMILTKWSIVCRPLHKNQK